MKCAGGHLHAVPARLVDVQKHPVGHCVLGGRGLDRHIGVEEDIRRTQQLRARVHEESQMVEPAA
jgi:hypothetical protein